MFFFPGPLPSFSVIRPWNISNNKLTWGHVDFIQGNDFDRNTGIFTCSVPGIYYFTVSLIKPTSDTYIDVITCHLFRNDALETLISSEFMSEETQLSGRSITNSVLLHLGAGDTVYLGSCTDPKAMEYYSSFTGFLVSAD